MGVNFESESSDPSTRRTMKISTLVQQLLKIHDDYGDLPCCAYNPSEELAEIISVESLPLSALEWEMVDDEKPITSEKGRFVKIV